MRAFWEFIGKNSGAITALLAILSTVALLVGGIWRFCVKIFAACKKRKKEKEAYKLYASLIDIKRSR